MITLKAVLVGSSCVGVLAVGGVTYATVGHPNLRSDEAKVPAAKPAAPAAPAQPALPSCLPKAPHGLPKAPAGAPHGLPKAGDAQHALPQQPGAAVQPGGAQQQVSGAQQEAQRAVGQHAQKVGDAAKAPVNQPHSMPAGKPGVPSAPVKAPGTDCLPSGLPKAPVPAHPAKPEVPQLPHNAKVNCDSVKPAIALGSKAERSLILARGLSHGTKHVKAVSWKAHKLCKVTEKWVGTAGQWLKVERLKTPSPYSLDQLRQAMQLPVGGSPVDISGSHGWTTPLGGVVFWYAPDGVAVFVSGSPAYAPQLQDVASKLQQ